MQDKVEARRGLQVHQSTGTMSKWAEIHVRMPTDTRVTTRSANLNFATVSNFRIAEHSRFRWWTLSLCHSFKLDKDRLSKLTPPQSFGQIKTVNWSKAINSRLRPVRRETKPILESVCLHVSDLRTCNNYTWSRLNDRQRFFIAVNFWSQFPRSLEKDMFLNCFLN